MSLVWCGAAVAMTEVARQMMDRYLRHVLVEHGRRLVVVSARDVSARTRRRAPPPPRTSRAAGRHEVAVSVGLSVPPCPERADGEGDQHDGHGAGSAGDLQVGVADDGVDPLGRPGPPPAPVEQDR